MELFHVEDKSQNSEDLVLTWSSFDAQFHGL